MRIQLATSDLQRLMPTCPGTAAHCHRVSALCREVASRLPISWRALSSLEQAALLHHTSPVMLDASGPDRLTTAVNAGAAAARRDSRPLLPQDLDAVLRAFHSPAPEPDRHTRLLAGILTAADLIDRQFESLNWDPRPVETLWEEAGELSPLAGEAVWKAAQDGLRSPYRLAPGNRWDLPVHGEVVREVVTGLRACPDCDVNYLAKLAMRDPVLAGNVLASANSAWFGRRTRVRSVAQAMAYIGADAGRRILLALALKPLYGSRRLADLWKHSLDTAGFCESLAAAAGFLPPGEALTLGLVHDIGRVALLRHSAAANGAFARLSERQCPPVYAEQMLFGEGHDEIGAAILRHWDFAPDLVEAVRAHHRPADADSPAACALYLAEFWSAADEDLPSARHLDAAQRRLSCSLETLARAGRAGHPLADFLRIA